MALIVLYTADDELMANSVRDLMIQNGITAMVRRTDALSSIVGTPAFGEPWGDVLVDEVDLDQADELLTGFFDTFCESEDSGGPGQLG